MRTYDVIGVINKPYRMEIYLSEDMGARQAEVFVRNYPIVRGYQIKINGQIWNMDKIVIVPHRIHKYLYMRERNNTPTNFTDAITREDYLGETGKIMADIVCEHNEDVLTNLFTELSRLTTKYCHYAYPDGFEYNYQMTYDNRGKRIPIAVNIYNNEMKKVDEIPLYYVK